MGMLHRASVLRRPLTLTQDGPRALRAHADEKATGKIGGSGAPLALESGGHSWHPRSVNGSEAKIEKKPGGPAFLRFVAPIVDTLKEFGGAAPAGAVTARVIERTNLSKSEQAEKTSNGQARCRNQIHWARFYLAKAGLLDAPQRAEWRLTEAGRNANLDTVAVLALFAEVQGRFKDVRRGEVTVDHDEDELEAPEEGSDTELLELDEDLDEQTIDSPYDPSKTVIETKLYSMDLLVRRLKYGEIKLDPEFQRGANLWTDERMSRLVESILIRIPLPVFYFDATNEHEWVVVDGLQRLSTIKRFVVEDGLKLTRLEYLKQHEGKTFSMLPRDLQRRIEETQVTAHLIQPGTPPNVKYNIFRRINTGGLVLTAQEIRHALNQGPATSFLAKLASLPEFRRATANGVDANRMLDRELVLRFIAFTVTPYRQYTKQNLDLFLTEHMGLLNRKTVTERDELEKRFVKAMDAAYAIFGNDAFRKRYRAGDARNPINKALFEAWSVLLGSLDGEEIQRLVQQRTSLGEAFMVALVKERAFDQAVTQGTGDVAKVHIRFARIEQLVRAELSRGVS
jgi:hypothetical protein